MKKYLFFSIWIIFYNPVLAQEDRTFTSLEEALANRDRVYTLEITGENIDELPQSIGTLTNLRRLKITGLVEKKADGSLFLRANKFTNLPSSFGNLINLESLDLSNGNLQELPDSFWDLQKLKKLDFGGNDFSEISTRISDLSNLENLSFRSNRLTNLPESIQKLKNLEWLHLAFNEFEDLPSFLTGDEESCNNL